MSKLYVVCLFLPNTLSFDLDETDSIKLNPQRSKYKKEPIPHLINKLASCSESFQDANSNISLTNDQESQFFYLLKNENIIENEKKFNDEDEIFEGRKKELNQPKFKSRVSSLSTVISQIPTKGKISYTMQNCPYVPILTSRRRRSSFDVNLFSKVPWTIESNDQSNVGLGNAIRAADKSGNLQEHMFIGLLGIPTDSLSILRKHEIEQEFITRCRSIPIFVSDNEFDNHYNYYCKQILWPIFHYQIPDIPKFKMYQDYSWSHYVTLNQAFANKIIENYNDGDIIWINDYHLLLVPQMIRQKLQYAMIGFFLHISFPSYEVFRCLSVRKQLLEGILGANVIGFQTDEYAYHFLQTCTKLLNVKMSSRNIQFESSFINICDLPIGIDPDNLEKKKTLSSVKLWISLLKERYSGKSLIVGRDKLDEIKGVRQKLLSFEHFLNKHSEWREKVVLIQVALPTSEENEIQSQVSNIVLRINSTYGNLSHQYQPVVFLRQDITFSQYLALLTVADAFLVTSLREGMNLTSHEFVFCQRGNYSPLIISEFVGSAVRFKDAAITINPWNINQVSNAIYQALTMSTKERLTRWKKLSDIIMNHDAAHWAINFINEIKCNSFSQEKKDSMLLN
ncbi:hypothetical protein T552_00772 [Pneumocystis carinii B80]|uniref:Uncharacterized protein n=1 Tax=Pneumocystis carinii (strain B80) TaxID=1408658 RepID=A0A0W4ZPI5_PNEC8|nr:hypothetical protein T552_00772 [Pneumocystis carinii B80]KTW30297.1 hypothetical protein T552_00772 [Pneumocystis carinii B80]